MKRIFLVSLICFCTLSSMAQQLTLSGYTYTDDNKIIGIAEDPTKTTVYKKFAVKGPLASAFAIKKNGQLSVRPNTLPANTFWHDVTIEATTAEGKVVTNTFRIVKDQFIRNKVIAHRGAWKKSGTTENSLTALRNAVALGCMGSEFDIHLSADSIPYINHDAAIQGFTIEKTESSQLSQIKLSNGESLPTLLSYLQEGMKQNRTRLILELKPSVVSKERALLLTEKVIAMVRELKAQAWAEYISFDYDVCKKIKSMEPHAKVAYLNGELSPAQLAADHIDGLDYHHSILKKNESWFEEAHQKKQTVNVWTVNEKSLMEWLLQKNVDFITTNEPEMLLEIVQ
ncbi:glycerophosphodiester phosphodiesterase family protein [Cytophagaceae bacterium NT2B1]|nr:glycerophosphodiester phosphodiesterase family protein [Xanthocytophaga flavus]